jgi:uncharacterized protein
MADSLALPSAQAIEALHRKYALTDEVFKLVFTHCQIVRDIALQLAQRSGLEINTPLTEVGCLLHDIGVYPLFDSIGKEREGSAYITHGIRGEEILRREGFPEVLCRFASHHTGAGITKAQIIQRQLPLPPNDYLAETPEEQLVMYADKFHSKTNPPYFNSHAYYTNYVARFGEESVKSFAGLTSKFGLPDLRALAKHYKHTLRDV